MRLIFISVMVASLAVLGGCSDGDGAIGDAASLRSALASAVPGDRVCLTAGVFEGSFDVPAGVTLCGAGVGTTRIVGPAGTPALRLTPGAGVPTHVEQLTVDASGAFGIVAIGAGEVLIDNAEVRVPTNGAGIGAESLSALRMTDVQITGPVTTANAEAMPLEPSIEDSATYGLVAVSVMTLEASRVDVGGFAYVGVLSVSTNMTWGDGGISSNLGTGLLVHGGTADIDRSIIDSALQGTRLIPAYNAVFAGDADVSTNALEVSGGGGYGILQSAATATHADLQAMDNRNAALWVQNSGGVSVVNGLIGNNGMAGLVALESSGIDVTGTDIEDTQAMTRIFGTMPVMVGDGVHLIGSTTGVTLEDLGLHRNARVGILLDLEGGTFDDIEVISADVDGDGDQLGAIAQNGVVPPGWDQNIVRSAVIEANDIDFTGFLDTVGIVGPSDLPAVNAVLDSGIAGIVGPSD